MPEKAVGTPLNFSPRARATGIILACRRH
jgi:hypothetical protein